MGPQLKRRRSHAEQVARAWWKAIYRLIRIHRRESAKMMDDVMCFGSGFLYVDSRTGETRHLPLGSTRPQTVSHRA